MLSEYLCERARVMFSAPGRARPRQAAPGRAGLPYLAWLSQLTQICQEAFDPLGHAAMPFNLLRPLALARVLREAEFKHTNADAHTRREVTRQSGVDRCR
jgi:hypothetical protein